jgi:hypothetical protein
MNIRFLKLLCVSSLLMALGCGHRELGRVKGTVSYQGKPLASGAVVFEVPGKRTAQGKIVDGRITEVTTFTADDGVPVGKARIAVFGTEPVQAGPPQPKPKTPAEAWAQRPNMTGGKSVIPAKYNSPATSGLTHDIVSGENVLKLDLE